MFASCLQLNTTSHSFNKAVRLCRRLRPQAKSDLEILAAVFPLIWNVRGVIYDDIECLRFERHIQAGAQDIRPMPDVDVHPKHRPGRTSPEPPFVHRCIQNPFRGLLWVELEHSLQQPVVGALPYRWNGFVLFCGEQFRLHFPFP